MNIGIVQNENFDRLRKKNFGTDSLIALTILEHHARYDDGGNDHNSNEKVGIAGTISLSADSKDEHASNSNSNTRSSADVEQQRHHRMQLKALEIKRKLLTQQIISETSILDLYSFLHATEEHLALLSSLNAWKSLLYYSAGGVYRDVLEVHRDCIKMCISEAGGIKEAIRLVMSLPFHYRTDQWPSDLRLKILEIFRTQLLTETKTQKQTISELLNALAQSVEATGKSKGGSVDLSAMEQNLTLDQQKLFKQSRQSYADLNKSKSVHRIPSNDSTISGGSGVEPYIVNSNKTGSASFILPPSALVNTKIDEDDDGEEGGDDGGGVGDGNRSVRDDVSIMSTLSKGGDHPALLGRRRSMRGPGSLTRNPSILKSGLMGRSERGINSFVNPVGSSGVSLASQEEILSLAERDNLLQGEREADDASSLNSDNASLLSYGKHRTLHGRVDEICFSALHGSGEERKLLFKLMDAFYNWESNHNITANALFQSCLGMINNEVDIVITALVKASLNSEMPLLMTEIYEKIRNIIDYYTFKESFEEEISKEKERLQEKVSDSSIFALLSVTNSLSLSLFLSLSQLDGVVSKPVAPVVTTTAGGITITNESAKVSPQKVNRRRSIQKPTFDCATQTTFPSTSPSKRCCLSSNYLSLPVVSSLNPSDQLSSGLPAIPSGFRLALLYNDSEFEIAPGIFIASIKRLISTIRSQDPKLNRLKASYFTSNLSTLANASSASNPRASLKLSSGAGVGVGSTSTTKLKFKTVEMLLSELSSLPENIRYCYGSALSPFSSSPSAIASIELPSSSMLTKVPSLLDLMTIKDCIPLLFPSVLPLSQGINLITGYRYNGQGNDYLFNKLSQTESKISTKELVTLPYDLLLFQIAENNDLPRGTISVDLASQLSYDSSLFYTQRKELSTMRSALTQTVEGEMILKEWEEIKLPSGK
jgi:hypothetical protein